MRDHTTNTYTIPTIELLLEPKGEKMTIPRPKTVLQLLNRLSLASNSVLVIRDNTLLTPDRRLYPDDKITVRIVTSSG